MLVPIGDDNPLKSIPFQFVTVALIAANVLVFLLEQSGVVDPALATSFAVVPRELFQAGLLGGAVTGYGETIAVPERLTLLSYMFFHADIMHLVGNMLFLWVFGDNVEDAVGHFKFLLFYLISGVAAGLLHAYMVPASDSALIGASGAVAGVIAAYLLLHPRVQVWVVAFKVLPLKINAAIVLGLWLVTQIVMIALPEVGPTAWWAHIGGFIAGAILIVFMRRRGVPLFAP